MRYYNLINDDKRIKEIQIGDHEIKIVNFTDNTTIFLRELPGGHSKSMFAQDSQVLKLPPPCLPLFVFEMPPP